MLNVVLIYALESGLDQYGNINQWLPLSGIMCIFYIITTGKQFM